MKPLVFLHGWGQSARIWYQQQQAFPDAHYLHLPGHGGSADADDWFASCTQELPQVPCHLIGWSLGGMLAMKLALSHPKRIQSLILVNTTPRFRQSDNWKYGCDDEIFQAFEQGVEHQAGKTMSRFFAMMFHGEDISRSDYQSIAHQAIDRHHPPTQEGLQHGLTLLSEMDLHDNLSNITQPTLIISGDSDAIISPKSSRTLAEHIPHATLHRFRASGHAPFLSHSAQFNSLLEQWCQTH